MKEQAAAKQVESDVSGAQPDVADRSDVSGAQPDAADRGDDATGAGHSPRLGLMQIVSSVFAAGLGVQSSQNRERDFKEGRALTFIIAGLVFTALFIGALYTVVSLVLSSR